MKELVNQKIAEFGSAKLEGGVDGANIVAKATIELSYPLLPIVEKATVAVDALLDKVEQAIPGDWDKPMIEKFKEEYKQHFINLLSTVA